MTLQRVVVTGMGAVTPLGCNVESTWKAYLEGRNGLKKVCKENKCQIFGPLHQDFDEQKYQSTLGNSLLHSLAIAVCDEALKDAQMESNSMIDPDRIAINFASFGGFYNLQRHAMETKKKIDFLKGFTFTLPCILAMKYNFKGPLDLQQQACASGAISIGQAYRLIKHGYADAALAGGADVNLDSVYHHAADYLGATNTNHNETPDQLMRPYDSNRGGIAVSNGGAALFLESLESAQKRNAHIYCEIVGFHQSNEAYHVASPTAQGYGAFKCLRSALKEANIENNQIDAINSHATSTIVGDAAEANSIKMILGTKPERLGQMAIEDIFLQDDKDLDQQALKNTIITAPKSNIGHTFSGAGAIECMLSSKQIQEGITPCIRNLKTPCEPLLNFVMDESVKKDINILAKTSLGFGSNCSALIFRKIQV